MIFHDATLREIATARPASLAALGTVNGVGENKLAKYGEQILEVLAGQGAAAAGAPVRGRVGRGGGGGGSDCGGGAGRRWFGRWVHR
ncbi:hypothetical protein SRIMM317S_02049 [Streptomyces rimosus subsp. rimosus]